MQNNQMNPLEQGAPWLANYGDVPFHLEYPNVSIADAVLKTAGLSCNFLHGQNIQLHRSC